MEAERTWMYNSDRLTTEFFLGVNSFLNYAFSNPKNIIDGDCVKCPCQKCGNARFYTRGTIEDHLIRWGFRDFYSVWYMHGERPPENMTYNSVMSPEVEGLSEGESGNPMEEMVRDDGDSENPMEEMVRDVAGRDFDWDMEGETPNLQAQKFFEMLKAADEPLWDGCNKQCTLLSCVAELLAIKSDLNLTKEGFNRILSAMKRCLPEDNKLPANYYQSKKLVSGLGLDFIKYDACTKHCMLYYGTDEMKESCDLCNEPRYKERNESAKGKPVPQKVLRYQPITQRLQRLYMSPATAQHMQWHKYGVRDKEGVMVHPADGEAWKHFDSKYPEFAAEPRNVRIALCTDGFVPFNIGGHPYTCWPVFIVPYNLPPGMIMRTENVMLPLLIPGPTHPGKSIDIYLRPLIDELKTLWADGVETYDSYKKENFMMKVAVVSTVSDSPATAMLSGWTAQGRMACATCMEDTKAFQLVEGGKTSWFDCHRRFLAEDHPFRFQENSFKKNTIELDPPPRHLSGEEVLERVMAFDQVRFGTVVNDKVPGYLKDHNWKKRSIFWELPYWKNLLVRHNIDMMHLETNFLNNLLHTLWNTKDKTKDNAKARSDMALVCDRPGLELSTNSEGKIEKPRATYCLTRESKRAICEWAKNLRFLDGYASNLSNSVNLEECKFVGMKSHDCHIFMERLLPIAIRDFVPDGVWEAITEVGNFWRDVFAKEVDPSHILQLEKDIVVTICKLEKIFPPGFFDLMEHLIVHVGYEARMGGPNTFRCMYRFESCIKELKKRIKNKANVEGSVMEEWRLQEISKLCSLYFADEVVTRFDRSDRYDYGECSEDNSKVSVVSYPGRAMGQLPVRELSEEEYNAAHLYVLCNCQEMGHFVDQFDAITKMEKPNISDKALERTREKKLAAWVREVVLSDATIESKIGYIGRGPFNRVKCFNMYDINGYRFHTRAYGENKKTTNSGVCVKGSNWRGIVKDYYGIIEEIIQLEYGGANNTVVLFKCHWFDPNRGVRIDEKHGFVEVNHRSSLRKYEPFVLAYQAVQVYYVPYPSTKRERRDWWVAYKTRPRLTEPILAGSENTNAPIEALAEYFQEEGPPCPFTVTNGDTLDIPRIFEAGGDPEIVPEVEVPYYVNRFRNQRSDRISG